MALPQPETSSDLRALYRAAEARAARLRVLVEASKALAASAPDAIEATAAAVAVEAARLAGYAWGRILTGPQPVTPGDGQLAVPLCAPGGLAEPIGTLVLEQRIGSPSAEDREALALVAQLIGSALAARTREERLTTLLAELLGAQEAERSRVAHELHDGVAQSAAALARRLELAADGDPEDLAEATLQARALVRELRQVIVGMRPPVLDDLGLEPALRQLAADAGEALDVSLTIRLQGRPAPMLETTLFRIVQEALSNARAHAGPGTRMEVRIDKADGCYRLELRDDGRGFDVAALPCPAAGRGLGLAYMRERIMRLGGRMTVESAPGAGCCLKVELPIR